MATDQPNTMFPGRPDYVGPTSGMFGLLHHDKLYENSDNVMERVEYVKHYKPQYEIKPRLRSMIYLGSLADLALIDARYAADLALIDARYAADLALIDARYAADLAPIAARYAADLAPIAARVLEYVMSNMPDCAWDGN